MNTPQHQWSKAIELYHQGQFRQCDRQLKKLFKKHPMDANGQLLSGMVAAALENWSEAYSLLNKAVKQLPQQVEAWITLGNVLRALNRMDDAIEHYQQAWAIKPTAEACHNIAVCYEDMGDLVQALEFYNRSLQLNPDFKLTLLNRAPLLGRLRKRDEADSAYRDLLDRYAGDVDLQLDYARWLEQSNRTDQAKEILPDCGTLKSSQLARCASLTSQLMVREGQLDQALQCLQQAYDKTRAGFLGFRLGRICDRLGRHDDAMRYFVAGNRYRRKQWQYDRLLKQPVFEVLAAKQQRINQLNHERSTVQGQARMPVFLMGLPRSGTTLLNRLLDLHPSIQVLEEVEALRVASDLYELDRNADVARQRYWQQVNAHKQIDDHTLVIDKHPFHAMHLDVLPELFPAAKVIYLHRHPLDAALSCFMQDFDPGPVTAQFTSLEDSARICKAFIELMDGFSSQSGNAVYHLHYEDLVSDADTEMSKLFDFLGLDWNRSDFDPAEGLQTAEPVMTASYDQIVRPVYRDSIGRWKHYQQFIELLHTHLDDRNER